MSDKTSAQKKSSKTVETDTPISVSGTELSGWLNITNGRVTQLTGDDVFKKNDSNKYDLKANVKSYCEYLQSKKKAPIIDIEEGKEFANNADRKAYYESERIRDEVMQNRQHLLKSEETADAIFAFIELIREFMLILPDVLERDTGADPQVIGAIEKMCHRKLKALESESSRICKPLGIDK